MKNKMFKNRRDKKISAVILSFHRPENINIILESLEKISIIDEVIIWHSNPQIKLEIPEKFSKAVLVSTTQDFGLNVRWHASILAKNEAIFMQDDDWLLSEKAIRKLYNYWAGKPTIIHSMWNKIAGQIYSPIDDKSGGKAEIVLTNALMFHRKYAIGLLQILPSLEKKIIELTKRNGEDILFSYYVMSQSRERNVVHDLGSEVTAGLSHKNAICQRPNFRQQRDSVIGYCIRHFAPRKIIRRKKIRFGKIWSLRHSADERIGKIGIYLKEKNPKMYSWLKKHVVKDGVHNLFGIYDFIKSFKAKPKEGRKDVVGIHRIDKYNTGDKYSNPARYFDFLENIDHIDLKGQWGDDELSKIRDKAVILGGGGLIGHGDVEGETGLVGDRYFRPYLDAIFNAKPKKLIAWGVGHNTHGSKKVSAPAYLENFDLVGVRDFGTQYPWVPCSSCMSPLFDKKYKIKNKVAVYEHQSKKYPIGIDYLPKMTNREIDFEKVIDFLGSSEVILTNSYHGAYWGTLLNRKVVLVNPFSSKFHAFKHQLQIADETNWQQKVLEAENYPESLRECRTANIDFAKKVREVIDSI